MRRDRRPLLGLLLLVAMLAPSASAWAQPASPTPPAPGGSVEPKSADDYALEGRELAMKPGMMQDARDRLATAWSMKRSFDIAGNLGSIEYELGLWRDAAEHLLYCKQNFPAVRDQAQTEKLARVETLLAKAREQVTSVRIRVTDADGMELLGSEVLVDKAQIGRVPLPDEVFVEPGERLITARHSGFSEASKQIKAEKGGTESVTVALSPLKQAANKVDKPLPPPPPKPGQKNIVLIAAGAGAAAVGLGLGLGTHLASNGASSDAQSTWESLRALPQGGAGACHNPVNHPECEKLRSSFDSKETLRGVAIGGYVVGGLLAVGTAAYALIPTSKLPNALLKHGSTTGPSMRAFVSVAPGGGGAVIEGRF